MIVSSEKGILKKPGPPYCGLDRLSSSSQNNLVNLTDRRDRPEISDVERTLKSLNGYHEDILEVLTPDPASEAELTFNFIQINFLKQENNNSELKSGHRIG